MQFQCKAGVGLAAVLEAFSNAYHHVLKGICPNASHRAAEASIAFLTKSGQLPIQFLSHSYSPPNQLPIQLLSHSYSIPSQLPMPFLYSDLPILFLFREWNEYLFRSYSVPIPYRVFLKNRNIIGISVPYPFLWRSFSIPIIGTL